MILISILLIILILIIYQICKNKIFKNKDNIEGLNTFTGKLAIDDQYFYDKLFDDVHYYPNEADGTTGWVRCRSECPGHCVEFGISSNAYCFSY